MNTTALIIGAAAIGGLFIVWRAASKPPAGAVGVPAAPCTVSYGGAGVSCGTIKQTVATAQKDLIAASKGIAAVPAALLGSNPKRGLFASATGQLGTGGFTGVARGTT